MLTRQVTTLGSVIVLGLLVVACDDFKPSSGAKPSPSATNSAAPQTTTLAIGPSTTAAGPLAADASAAPPSTPSTPAPSALAGSSDPRAAAIEASLISVGQSASQKRALLIKVEVLLDRAHFSPGVIDGKGGANLKRAIAAFEQARGIPGDGAVDAALVTALTTSDNAPVTQDYVITSEDERGPFLGKLPAGFAAQAKLDHLGYLSPLQELAEKFHMDQALLIALNPKADLAVAGTSIVVVRPGTGDLGAKVARVEVDKAVGQLRALDGGGKILAVFPATVGSTDRPAPSGEWAVKLVTSNPNYSYDPSRLTFGPADKGKLVVQPGPNNPVGSTWIALTKETYGIHGAPDPTRVGKTASHGCVRLTNWDAATLGRAVKKGTPVAFVGTEKKTT